MTCIRSAPLNYTLAEQPYTNSISPADDIDIDMSCSNAGLDHAADEQSIKGFVLILNREYYHT